MICKICGGRMYEITDPTYGCECDTCGLILKMVSWINWIEDRSEMEEGE